jgi:hypothetical protein
MSNFSPLLPLDFSTQRDATFALVRLHPLVFEGATNNTRSAKNVSVGAAERTSQVQAQIPMVPLNTSRKYRASDDSSIPERNGAYPIITLR